MSEVATAVSSPTAQPATTVVEKSGTPAPGDWTSQLTDDLKGYVQNKGFKDPAMVIEGYRNLEKLRGVPAERLLTLPERYDDVEGWKQVHSRIGRPEKPEDYKIPGAEGSDENFQKSIRSMFHEAGLSARQAETLATKWNAWTSETQKAQEAAYNAKIQEADTKLKAEWGMAFDENVNAAKKAASAFGLKAEDIDAMEKAIGFSPTMKFFLTVGQKMGEADFVSGGKGGAPKLQTPEAAKARIADLMTDTPFLNRLMSGELSAKEEWDRLHQMAHPSQG